MSNNSLTIQLDPLSLSNVCDGEMERQFQENILPELAAAFEVANDGVIPWELSGGRATCKVKVSLEFIHSFETGITAVKGGVDITLPKRKKTARPVMIRDGAVFTERSLQVLRRFQRCFQTGYSRRCHHEVHPVQFSETRSDC